MESPLLRTKVGNSLRISATTTTTTPPTHTHTSPPVAVVATCRLPRLLWLLPPRQGVNCVWTTTSETLCGEDALD